MVSNWNFNVTVLTLARIRSRFYRNFVMLTCHIFKNLNFRLHINTRTPFASNALSFSPLWNYIFDIIFFILRVLFFAFCLSLLLFIFFFHKFYSYLLFRSLVIHHNNTQLSRSPAIRLYMSNMKNSFPSAVSHQIALLLFFASIERLVVYIFDTLSLTNGGSIWAYGVHVNFVCQSVRSFVCICGVNVMHCTNTYACNGFI